MEHKEVKLPLHLGRSYVYNGDDYEILMYYYDDSDDNLLLDLPVYVIYIHNLTNPRNELTRVHMNALKSIQWNIDYSKEHPIIGNCPVKTDVGVVWDFATGKPSVISQHVDTRTKFSL